MIPHNTEALKLSDSITVNYEQGRASAIADAVVMLEHLRMCSTVKEFKAEIDRLIQRETERHEEAQAFIIAKTEGQAA